MMVAWLSDNALERRCSTLDPVSTWMGDRLRAGKPATQVNSAFHPSGVGKQSTSLTGWG